MHGLFPRFLRSRAITEQISTVLHKMPPRKPEVSLRKMLHDQCNGKAYEQHVNDRLR